MFKFLKPVFHAAIIFLMFFSQLASADVLDKILEKGKIRVGVSLFVPFTMQSSTGKLTGFEIEVANHLAKDLGVDTEVQVYNWEDIIPALENDEIDIISVYCFVIQYSMLPRKSLPVVTGAGSLISLSVLLSYVSSVNCTSPPVAGL